MRTLTICLAAVAPMAWAVHETQTWMASPASAEWSATAPNWDEGVAWGQSNFAVFAESTVTNIVVPGTTYVTDVSFTKGNWKFTGDGMIGAEVFGTGTNKDKHGAITCNVPEGVSVEFAVPMKNNYGYNFEKYGMGTMTLSGGAYFFRTAVYGGTLRFVNCGITTAKMQNYRGNSASGGAPYSKLHFDGATIMPCNNNIMLGETDNEFDDVTVGAGGITFAEDANHLISALRIKHAMRPADDLGDAVDGGVTMAGPYNFYIASDTCDLKGGFKFLNGTSYLKCASGVGTGPIYLDAPLYATNYVSSFGKVTSMTLMNDITFGTNGVLGLAGEADYIEFTNVAFAAGNDTRRVALESRNGGGMARYVRGADAPSIGGFNLSGGISLKVDGDTWLADSAAYSPFVAATAGSTIPVYIAPGGLVFDTNGRDLSLGAVVAFQHSSATNHFEQLFDNGSFENDTTGWKFGGGGAGGSDVRFNGGPFDGGKPAYQTRYDTHYAQVRSGGGSIETTFSVPEDGMWQISFDYANRYDHDTQGLLQWSVLIDGETVREMSNDGLGNHGFMTYRSPAISFQAGTQHTFKFVTGASTETSNFYDSMLVDGVRLSREIVTENPVGSLTKTGAGTLAAPYLEYPGTVNVQQGVLAADGMFASNTVNVASGATFAFRASSEVEIPNASFEEGTGEGDRGFSYSGQIAGWLIVGGSSNSFRPSWQRNESQVTGTGPHTTNGTYTAYLRPSCSISANVYVPHDGIYELSFEQASRWGPETSSQSRGILLTITATIDDDVALVVPPRSISGEVREEFNRVSATVSLTAGNHVLKIATDDADGTLPLGTAASSGTMVFIDAVRLVGAKVDFEDHGATWNFASGATVDVGDADIVLDKVYVNGMRIRGGKPAFTAAGLNVIGTGSFRSGPLTGMRIILR